MPRLVEHVERGSVELPAPPVAPPVTGSGSLVPPFEVDPPFEMDPPFEIASSPVPSLEPQPASNRAADANKFEMWL